MIKIALFLDFPKNITGGIKTYCENIKNLFENNSEISITLFPKLPYTEIGVLRLYDKVVIKKALLSDNFDIVHINGFISTIPYFITKVMKSLKMEKPLVYTPHAHPFYTLNHPFLNKIFFHLFVKQTLKIADKVIAINKEDFCFFSKYNRNVVTIPHWSISKPITVKKIQTQKPIILFVGRNDANKNLSQLYILPKDKYEIICVTNTKPERDDFVFKKGISSEELNDLYLKASLTVIPSRYEAFSYTALESLWNGTPVLISNRVRIADFLENISGVTIYDFEKPESFLSKIDIAINQVVETDKIHKLFSKETALMSYSNVYNSIKYI
jgi:glycosyltransferase involved in cell wall biosynthesis